MKMIFSSNPFAPLFWVQFFGALNDNFFKNALVFLIAFQGITLFGMGSESLVALASGVFILPYFLFSPIAGQLADKYEKSQLVRYTKILEIVVMLLASIGFALHEFTVLLGVLFLMGLQSTIFGPVKYSMIPEVVKEDELIQGNALVELGTFLAILIGTIAGGLVVGLANSTFWIVLGIMGLSLVGYACSVFVKPVVVADASLEIEINPIPTMRSLWKIIGEQEAIFNSVFAISWFWFIGAGILSVLPIYCTSYLMVGEEVVTAFLAMFTLGIAIGSVLCEKMCFGRVEIGLVPLGSLGLSVFLMDLALVTPDAMVVDMPLLSLGAFLEKGYSIRLLVDFFCMSVFGGVFIVPLYTLLQERSRPEVRSQVIAANNIINALFMVLSSLALIGFYASNLSLAQIFLVFSLMNIIVAIYIYSVVPEFVLRFCIWILSNVLFRLRVRGFDNIPKEGGLILVANHITYVDWLILAGISKRPARFVMYHTFFHIPVIRYFMKQAKVIPICGAKENAKILEDAMQTISTELAAGEVLCIFPEGQLTGDGALSPFRPGLLKMLEKNPVPVVPIAMHNLYGSVFSRSSDGFVQRLLRSIWHRVDVDIAKPIQPQDVDMAALQTQIQDMLNRVDRN